MPTTRRSAPPMLILVGLLALPLAGCGANPGPIVRSPFHSEQMLKVNTVFGTSADSVLMRKTFIDLIAGAAKLATTSDKANTISMLQQAQQLLQPGRESLSNDAPENRIYTQIGNAIRALQTYDFTNPIAAVQLTREIQGAVNQAIQTTRRTLGCQAARTLSQP